MTVTGGLSILLDDDVLVLDEGEFVRMDDGTLVPVEEGGYLPGIVEPGFDPPVVGEPGGTASGVGAASGLVVLLVVAGVVVSIVVAVRKYRLLKRAGVDPFTVDAAVAAKLLNSDVLAPPATERALEARLAELDDLRARGVISDAEHRDARAAVLRG